MNLPTLSPKEAGTNWYYNNCYHQVRKIIEKVTDGTTQEACADYIFEPLGMTRSHWAPRPQMIDPNGWILSGLMSNALDLARTVGTAT